MQSTTKFTEPWGKFTDPFDLVYFWTCLLLIRHIETPWAHGGANKNSATLEFEEEDDCHFCHWVSELVVRDQGVFNDKEIWGPWLSADCTGGNLTQGVRYHKENINNWISSPSLELSLLNQSLVKWWEVNT